MEESILIESRNYKKIYLIIACIGFLATLAVILDILWDIFEARMDAEARIAELKAAGGYVVDQIAYWEERKEAWTTSCITMRIHEPFIPIVITLVSCFATRVAFSKTALVVTNRRVYGTIVFGVQVDIPVDSISAASKVALLKGITVASSSGKITFMLIDNASEIYDVIIKLLHERQKKNVQSIEIEQTPKLSNADEIKKYKDLLDCGAITQEEFDAKKKQLLGL